MGDSSEAVDVQKPKMSKLERKLFKIAQKYWQETKPVREGFYDVFQQQREGTFEPTEHPLYEPMYRTGRSGLESQYGAAREAIMSQLPKGGQLNEALVNLEMDRAQAIGGLEDQIAQSIVQDMINKSYGVAFQSPQTSVAGLSAAAGPYASRYGADIYSQIQAQQMQNQLFAGLGSGLGNLGGQMFSSGALGNMNFGGDKGTAADLGSTAIGEPWQNMYGAPY